MSEALREKEIPGGLVHDLPADLKKALGLRRRGYGKPPQHITGEGGPRYVVRLPEPCKTAEEWVQTLEAVTSPLPIEDNSKSKP